MPMQLVRQRQDGNANAADDQEYLQLCTRLTYQRQDGNANAAGTSAALALEPS